MHIVAAIRGLSDSVGRVEALWPATTAMAEPGHTRVSSLVRWPSFKEGNVDQPDAHSLYAQDSPFESDEQSDGAAGSEQLKYVKVKYVFAMLNKIVCWDTSIFQS